MTSTGPGWYPDPGNAEQLRWWDGGQWGARQEPAPAEANDPTDEVLTAAGIAPATAPGPAEPWAVPEVQSARPKRRWWKWALASFGVLVIVGGLTGWAVNEHSIAGSWRRDAKKLQGNLDSTSEKLRKSDATVKSQKSQLSALASEKARVADERQQLQQIISTVPSVTNGLRDCASAAIDVSKALADYLGDFPYGSSSYITDAIDHETSVCTTAGTAANTLDAIIDGMNS